MALSDAPGGRLSHREALWLGVDRPHPPAAPEEDAVCTYSLALLTRCLPAASAFLLFIVISPSPKRRLHYVTMPFSSNKRATFPNRAWVFLS